MDKTERKKDLNKKCLLIGKASKMSGPCANTIKRYVAEGIVTDVRDARNRRLFSLSDVAKIRAVYAARNPERVA